MFIRAIYNYFDRFEDRVRARFSHWPITYALLGGTGMVLFWRGVWHTYDYFMFLLFPISFQNLDPSLGGWPWWDGPVSMLIGVTVLLSIGTFVSEFVNNEIIVSGIKGEKKLIEKAEEEISIVSEQVGEVEKEIQKIDDKLDKIEETVDSPKQKS